MVLVVGLSEMAFAFGEPRMVKNLAGGGLRKAPCENRNLMIPGRFLSVVFTGAAGQSALEFLPDGTELPETGVVCPAGIPRSPLPEIQRFRQGSNFH